MGGVLSITQLLLDEHINKIQYEMNESQAIQSIRLYCDIPYMRLPALSRILDAGPVSRNLPESEVGIGSGS